MMKARTSLWASLAIAASVGLAGCGGSSDNGGDGKGEMSHEVTLPKNHGLSVGDLEDLKKGEDVVIDNADVGTTTIACDSDDGCVLTIKQHPVTGLYSATSTGGRVMVTLAKGPEAPEPPMPPIAKALPLPSGNNLTPPMDGTPDQFTIAAGGERVIGNVKFECKGSTACTVTVSNLLGQPDVMVIGMVDATLVVATDGGAATTPTPGAGGDGTGSNAFLSRASLLEAVRYSGSMLDEDEGIGSGFKVVEGGGRPSVLGSYHGIEFEKSTSDLDDIVHIRSDIGAPVSGGMFKDLYGDLDEKTPGEVSSGDTNDFWSLVGGVGGSGTAGNKQITSATYIQGEEISGVTFGLSNDPVMGTLICESGSCVVTNRGGELSAPGVWTFKTSQQDKNVVIPDADYLVFGYWKQTPQAAEDAQPVRLEAFYAGSEPFKTDNVVGLAGTANYDGRVVGRYAHRAKEQGSVLGRGELTAMIRLTVDFGTASQSGTISGNIGSTKDGMGNIDLGGQSISAITLPRTNISASGTFSGGKPDGYTGGSWRGQFFGNPAKDDANPNPHSAAGMFKGWEGSAVGSGGYTSLEGSFGTNLDPGS